MELFNAQFDTDYFSFLLGVIGPCVVGGVLIPFGFWAAGALIGGFVDWVRSFI